MRQMLSTHRLCLLLIVCATAAVTATSVLPDRVLLSDVTALTFRQGQMTKARRSTPIGQLKCVGGPCASADIRVVQCANVGHDGSGDVQWKCEADMPKEVVFDYINVNCEGYESSSDPYVLRGSCGLEYTLRRSGSGGGGSSSPAQSSSTSSQQQSGGGVPWLFLIVVAVAFWFIFIRKPNQGPNTTSPGGRGGWFGGGGGGGGGGGYGGTTAFRSGSYTQTEYAQPRQQEGNGGWRFMQGLLGGVLLANLFGGGNAYARPNYGYATGVNQAFATGGGGGGGTHTSTGYGGSSRR